MKRGPSTENGQHIWWDPRPDLKGDSAAWSRLLTMAWHGHGDGTPAGHIASTLDYFRTMGTRLRVEGERLVLYGDPQAALTWERQFADWPQLPEAWRRKILERSKAGAFAGWTTVEEYRQARDQWLRPWAHELADLLKRLAASGEGGMLIQGARKGTLDLGKHRGHDGMVRYA